MFSMVSEPIEIDKLSKELAHDAAGALVTFDGRVRNHNDGRHVLSLDYECYQALADKEGQKILEEAMEKFEVIEAKCLHRHGSLQIGDAAVWVGVIAAHRGAAFDACRYIIDEVKDRVPIWKKEFYEEGEPVWVACHCTGEHKHD